MKKQKTRLLLVLAVLILAMALSACGGGESKVTAYNLSISNDMSYDIEEIYIVSSSEKDWGKSLISSDLKDGKSTDIVLENIKDVKKFDMLVVDEDGDEYEFCDLKLGDKFEIEIIWDDDGIYLEITDADGKTSEVECESNTIPENLDYEPDDTALEFGIKNGLNFRLDKMHIVPEGEAWGSNYIEARALETGANTNIDLNEFLGEYIFDMWLVDLGGNNYGFYGLEIENGMECDLIWNAGVPELHVTYADGSSEVITGKYSAANPSNETQASQSKLPPVAVDKVAAPKVRSSNGGAVMHSDPGDTGYYYGLYGYYDPWGNFYYYTYDDNGYYDSYGNYCLYDSDPGDMGYYYGEFGYFDPWGDYYLYDAGYSYDYYEDYYDYYYDYYWYDDSYYDDGYYYYYDGSYYYYDSWDSYYYDYYDDYSDYWDYDDYYDWSWSYYDDYSYWDSSYWSDYWSDYSSSYSSSWDSSYSSWDSSYSSWDSSYSSWGSY